MKGTVLDFRDFAGNVFTTWLHHLSHAGIAVTSVPTCGRLGHPSN